MDAFKTLPTQLQYSTFEYHMFIRLMFGFYYELSSSRAWSVVGRSYCVLYIVSLEVLAVYCEATCIHDADGISVLTLYDAVYGLELLLNAMITLRHKDCLNDYLKGLDARRASGTYVNKTLYIFYVICSFEVLISLRTKIWLMGLRSNEYVPLVLFNIFNVTCCLARAETIIIFSLFLYQIMYCKKMLQASLSDDTLSSEDRITHIVRCTSIYKRQIINLNRTRDQLNITLIINIFFVFLRINIYALFCLQMYGSITTQLLLSMMHWLTRITWHAVVTLAPVYYTEQATLQALHMHRMLVDLLLDTADIELRRVVLEALAVMERYPTRYSIWHRCPSDKTLFIGFITLAITYWVALLQFKF